MGKKDGFLLYDRIDTADIDPLDRIKSFDEFHVSSDPATRRQQAARCMNCGVPFCQSGMKLDGMFTGCPLHNLVPEWNDMLYLGNDRHALSRLLKTNPFPEFTGRVCPALCEAACTCGMNGDSVTVRDNEKYIIEQAFGNGWIEADPPANRTDKKIAVIGSGPAGLAAAQALNRRGHNVTVYEKSDRAGGLLMYGIPNMKLDKRIVERRISLMRQAGVGFELNADVGKDVPAEKLLGEYDAVLLCCGAKQPRALNAPGIDSEGVYFAVDFLTAATKQVLDGNGAISAKDIDVVIVGGGDTGNDCVGTSIRLGARSVTQLEMMPSPPVQRTPDNPWPDWPRTLKTDYGQQEAIAVFGHDPRLFETTVNRVVPDSHGRVSAVETVKLKGRDKVSGSEQLIPCQLLLIAAGFTGCQSYIPKAFGIETDERGNIKTVRYGTNIPKLFAAGDARRGQSLVVWAISEGLAAAKSVDEYLMGYSEM